MSPILSTNFSRNSENIRTTSTSFHKLQLEKGGSMMLQDVKCQLKQLVKGAQSRIDALRCKISSSLNKR